MLVRWLCCRYNPLLLLLSFHSTILSHHFHSNSPHNLVRQLDLVLVCSGFHDRISQSGSEGLLQQGKKKYFLIVLEARIPRSRCHRGWFLVTPPFLACSQLASHHVLTWPFLTACVWRKNLWCLFLLYQDTSPVGLGPHSSDLV